MSRSLTKPIAPTTTSARTMPWIRSCTSFPSPSPTRSVTPGGDQRERSATSAISITALRTSPRMERMPTPISALATTWCRPFGKTPAPASAPTAYSMMRIPLILAALCAGLTSTAAAQYLRGVNISQAEWGDPISATYGSEYSYPSAPTFNYFAARALGFIRLQVQWERLQPALGGPLDSNNLAYLQQNVADAKAAGALVSIDPHNFARYAPTESQVANPCVIDNPCPGSPVNVTSADLADFWVKMSDVFKNEPAVVAYDLMNEPHDMGTANWGAIAQKVLAAIRAKGDNKLIMIPGDGWSNATNWFFINGAAAYINDPANNYYYEAHEYFDSDYSGSYAMTYAQELAANPDIAQIGVIRLTPFVNWCTANKVPCYLGEYGIPNNDPNWLTVLNNFLTALDAAGMPGTYWAAGELWANVTGCTCSLLSVQPANNFTTDAEQLPTLLAHVAPNAFRTAS